MEPTPPRLIAESPVTPLRDPPTRLSEPKPLNDKPWSDEFHREAPEEDNKEVFAILRVGLPVLAIVIVTAVLYLGRDILLPLAMATMLSVIFSPIAQRLERYVGRLGSAALVVLGAIAMLGAIFYYLTTELTAVADETAGYSDNIANKLTALQKNTPAGLQRIERAVQDVQQRVARANPKAVKAPRTVQAVTQSSFGDVLKPFMPVLSGLVDILLIIVLLFFLLYGRHDLRDRIVRLTARARISVASQAIETAGQTVSKYLLLFSLTNLAFGISTGLVVWMIGLPHPELWGLLGFLLRYIPYVGALIAAILPSLVAFAVFPGWNKCIEVLATFILLDQVAAQFIEPFMVGGGIGISPVALLISAMYWSWVWGPAGLLLATPLTACIKVAGDYIPALSFFSILLGSERPMEDYHDYYRRLLELDHDNARAVVIHYYAEHGFEATLSEVLIPTVIMAAEEFDQDNISPANLLTIMNTSRELIVELGNKSNKIQRTPRLRVLGVCAPGEVHNIALTALLQLLRQDEVAANIVSENQTLAETREFVRGFAPDLVCLSVMMNDSLPAALELVRAMREDSMPLAIIAGGLSAVEHTDELLEAGCSEVCATVSEGRRSIRNRIWERLRARRAFWNYARAPKVGAGRQRRL